MKITTVKHFQNDAQIQNKAKEERIKSVAAQSLHDLFLDELKIIYWSEKELTKAISKMVTQTTSRELSEALAGHLAVTSEHVTRLEEGFLSIGEKPIATRCEAMEGLIKEAEQIMERTQLGKIRDAGIISAASKIEHYEIATYGTLCFFAKTLKQSQMAALLHKTLEQEREASEKLSEIIESMHLEMAD